MKLIRVSGPSFCITSDSSRPSSLKYSRLAIDVLFFFFKCGKCSECRKAWKVVRTKSIGLERFLVDNSAGEEGGVFKGNDVLRKVDWVLLIGSAEKFARLVDEKALRTGPGVDEVESGEES